MSRQTFVIVGAKPAEALRQLGFEGRVVLADAEPERLFPSRVRLEGWNGLPPGDPRTTL